SRLSLKTIKGEDSELKHLFVETKRYVLAIMKVQNDKNLLDILVKAVTLTDEKTYEELCKSDKLRKSKHNNSYSNIINNNINRSNSNSSNSDRSVISNNSANSGEFPHLHDISKMKFLELKKLTLHNILKLETEGIITRKN